jgi:IMP and pyridine-specific 5'-nucleotidase
VPFVLNSQPAAAYDGAPQSNLDRMAMTAHQRYAAIFVDVEELINDHSECLRSHND